MGYAKSGTEFNREVPDSKEDIQKCLLCSKKRCDNCLGPYAKNKGTINARRKRIYAEKKMRLSK